MAAKKRSKVFFILRPHPRLRRYFPRKRGKRELAAKRGLLLPRLRGRWPEGPEGVSRAGLDPTNYYSLPQKKLAITKMNVSMIVTAMKKIILFT